MTSVSFFLENRETSPLSRTMKRSSIQHACDELTGSFRDKKLGQVEGKVRAIINSRMKGHFSKGLESGKKLSNTIELGARGDEPLN